MARTTAERARRRGRGGRGRVAWTLWATASHARRADTHGSSGACMRSCTLPLPGRRDDDWDMVGLGRVQQNASAGDAARAYRWRGGARPAGPGWRATGRPGPDGRADARSYVRNSSALLTFAAARAERAYGRAMENSE